MWSVVKEVVVLHDLFVKRHEQRDAIRIQVSKLEVSPGDILVVTGADSSNTSQVVDDIQTALVAHGIRQANVLILPNKVEVAVFPEKHKNLFQVMIKTSPESRS